MKLLYLIPGVGRGGGAERSLESMVRYWTDDNDVHIVTFSDRTTLAEGLIDRGARFTNLGSQPRIQLVRSLAAIVRAERPNLIHTTLLEADVTGRITGALTRTPVSSSLVNVAYGADNLAKPGVNAGKVRAWQAIDASTARLAVRFHALTEHVATTMQRRLMISPRRIEVIPRGRDPRQLGTNTPERRDASRTALGIGSEALIVATARHEWQKGLDVLIRAVPLVKEVLPDARVLIGGREGAMTGQLRSLADELGLAGTVSFIGQRDDVPELMCAADAFVVPSRWEGFGSILVEAMALGAPVVASDAGAITEVAGNPPWLRLFPVGDHIALAGQVTSTVLDKSKSASLAEVASERFAAGFTAERVAHRMMSFFDSAAGTSRWPSRPRS